MRPERHLVTGGGGYAGLRLGKALQESGHDVILFDINEPQDIPENITFIQGDIRNPEDIRQALDGVVCVYHLASYGMSGREQLNRKLIEEVNIGGTNNLLKLCREENVERLVYTSTFNVVFGGQVIENGDESLPYLPLEMHPDWYSRTKMLAEKSVLAANNSQLSNGRHMRTCALRLAGVYGPGEQRHLPRIVGYIEGGLFCMTYGAKDSLVEFLHVDNLVQAHIKAGEKLEEKSGATAAGQAYFISDNKPVNNFEFFRPLVDGLGYRFPKLKLPVSVVYYLAFMIEMLHQMIGPIYDFQPLLTRTEVYKTGVTHYFSNEKAKRDLGYIPTVQNDLTPAVQWFLDRGHGKKFKKQSSFVRFLVDLALAFMFAITVLSFLPITR